MSLNRGNSAYFFVLVALVLLLTGDDRFADAQLRQNFYATSCPSAEGIARAVVRGRIGGDRTLAASMLRLHFHDCIVGGCEGGILIDSTPGNRAEKDAPLNAGSLRGFDVIDQVKSAVESACPGVVSCADIVALAARDAVAFIGGPSWSVPTGRRDGRVSTAAQASRSLPDNNANLASITSKFRSAGLSQSDMVVLSGAHTIGTTQCSKITPRLYNFPGSSDGIDPTLNKAYAAQLRRSCPQGSGNRVPLDPTNGGEFFDSNYYQNVLNNAGLFVSDRDLLSTPATRAQVTAELNRGRFFRDFGAAMQKMGRAGVLTNGRGEIRKNCHRTN